MDELIELTSRTEVEAILTLGAVLAALDHPEIVFGGCDRYSFSVWIGPAGRRKKWDFILLDPDDPDDI